jgi:phosphopantothenoylcysteine decarboxylase
MNTLMWEHPLTARHLRQPAVHAGADAPPENVVLDALPAWLNAHCPSLRVVPPVSKELACGDVRVGALASLAEIGATVDAALSSAAP